MIYRTPMYVAENQNPRDMSCDLVAAFEAGLHINRIRFHAQQAWFLDQTEQAQRVLEAYDDLALTALRLLADIDARERLSARIFQSKLNFEEWFWSGSRIEGFLPYDALEAEVSGLARRIEMFEIIAPLLCQSALPLLYLGEFTDQGQHPDDVINAIVAEYKSALQCQRFQDPLPSDRCVTYQSFVVATHRPSVYWFRALRSRCDHLGLQCNFAGDRRACEADEARSAQDLVATISEVIREAIEVRFGNRPVEAGGTHDVEVQPCPLEITITMGDRCYALEGPLGESISLSPRETKIFGLFVNKVVAGQPHEIIEWSEINPLFLGNQDAQQCNSAAKFFSQLNGRLSDWVRLPNGAIWIDLQKREGRFLSRAITWVLDEKNPTINDMMRFSSSVRAGPTDPQKMAQVTEHASSI